MRPTAQAQKPAKQVSQNQQKSTKSSQPPIPRLDLISQAQALKPQAAKPPSGRPQQASFQPGRDQSPGRSKTMEPAPQRDARGGAAKATARGQPPLPTKQMVTQAQNLKPNAKSSQPPLPSTAQVQVCLPLEKMLTAILEDPSFASYLPDTGGYACSGGRAYPMI